jgi:hypothetical protein
MIQEFPLWKSRKFWLLVLDVVVSSAAFFGGRFLDPQAQEIINWAIVTIQPVFIAVIGAYTYQNVKLGAE